MHEGTHRSFKPLPPLLCVRSDDRRPGDGNAPVGDSRLGSKAYRLLILCFAGTLSPLAGLLMRQCTSAAAISSAFAAEMRGASVGIVSCANPALTDYWDHPAA